jgi:hypothetical protein
VLFGYTGLSRNADKYLFNPACRCRKNHRIPVSKHFNRRLIYFCVERNFNLELAGVDNYWGFPWVVALWILS